MISVQNVNNRILSFLDAENSDRYTFEQDIKNGINSSIDWIVTVFNKAFADKKLSEENLQDLIRTVIYQTSTFSRVNLNPAVLGYNVWSIINVSPEPTVYPANAVITPTATPYTSMYRSDVSFIKSKYSAKRLTSEQWQDKTDNIFEAGNERMENSFKSYAYLNYANYSSSAYQAGGAEIEINPEIPNKFVGITLLKYPTPVSLITDNIEFPKTLENLVIEKALNFISTKQGDQTNLYGITAREVQTLVQLMV